MDKVQYVKAQKQTREHECHWPGCNKQVPPAMWGCAKHWFMLPKVLRNKILATYRPGQERDLAPSESYVAAAQEAQIWIRNKLILAERIKEKKE